MPKHPVVCVDLKTDKNILQDRILELGHPQSGATGWEGAHGYSWIYKLADHLQKTLGLRLLLVHDARLHLRRYMWQSEGVTPPISKDAIRETSLDELDINSIAADEIVFFIPNAFNMVMGAWRVAYQKVCAAGKHVFDMDPLSYAMTVDKTLFTWLGQAAGLDLPKTSLFDLQNFEVCEADAAAMFKMPATDGGRGVLYLNERQLDKIRNGKLNAPTNQRVQASIDAWETCLKNALACSAPAFCLRQDYVPGNLVYQSKPYEATTRMFFAQDKEGAIKPIDGWHKLPTDHFEPNRPGTCRVISAPMRDLSARKSEDIPVICQRTALLKPAAFTNTGSAVAAQLEKLYTYVRSRTFNDVFKEVLAQADEKPIWFEYAWRAWTPFWVCTDVDQKLVRQVIGKITNPVDKVQFGLYMLAQPGADINAPLTCWAQTFTWLCHEGNALQALFRQCIAAHIEKNNLPPAPLWWHNADFVENLKNQFITDKTVRDIQEKSMLLILDTQHLCDLSEACIALFILKTLHSPSAENFPTLQTDIEKLEYIVNVIRALPDELKKTCAESMTNKMLYYVEVSRCFLPDDLMRVLKCYVLVGQYLSVDGVEDLFTLDSTDDSTEVVTQERITFIAHSIFKLTQTLIKQGESEQNVVIAGAQACLQRLVNKYKILPPQSGHDTTPAPVLK